MGNAVKKRMPKNYNNTHKHIQMRIFDSFLIGISVPSAIALELYYVVSVCLYEIFPSLSHQCPSSQERQEVRVPVIAQDERL